MPKPTNGSKRPAKPLIAADHWYEVRTSAIHAQGIFAKCDIPADTKIIEYVGEKITKAESERRAQARLAKSRETGEAAVYIFNLNKKQDLDGGQPGNVARLMNHSCDPNCEAIQSRGRIWLCARRAIKAGDELTFNYGFDLENWEDHPCLCGSKRCVGYIVDEELWPGLLKKMKERAKEVRNGKVNGKA